IVAREKRAIVGAKAMRELKHNNLLVTVRLVDRRPQLPNGALERQGHRLRRVQQTLREGGTVSSDVWLKRRKDTQAKLKGGDPVELAEVVRDGAQRVRALAERPSEPHLSPGEKDVYMRARQLLSEEIGVVRGVAEAD